MKQMIKSLFTKPGSTLRVIIATTAFIIGIDCPDVHQIIHWGDPNKIVFKKLAVAVMIGSNFVLF